ncbi:choline ABC transporter substrate-binding protein [Curvivirga aplysinae]|uniref:choline ABC transporter substrate-binding protein n=1 Tax=Curvivirga aplysinae TaxID=2529852 RepID=UPI0012BB7134|nr:choline ABC transporter substrate-binding protein [Curvivirga aplysinae]MTI08740.1 choline ABC transporter substrate-binding protein [Curvivirga aplysinae]
MNQQKYIKKIIAPLLAVASVWAVPSVAADSQNSCDLVRMAEPGWTDLALTTGTASVILKGLGYDTETKVLGIPVIYEAMVNRDLDVFLGYWDPAMETYFATYKDTGKIKTIHKNLDGAKFTFAVPKFVYEAGVTDFSDLKEHADKFDKKLYGLEAGSNELMFDVINDTKFGITDWEVIESSEQGMLAQVDRSIRRNKWIAFVGWAPHPMNTRFEIEYLTGGDDHYGPNFGGASVYTQVRETYIDECPNVSKLLSQLTFDVPMESKGMGYILEDGMSPEEAGILLIKENANLLDGWLKNVKTQDGADGLTSVKKSLGL